MAVVLIIGMLAGLLFVPIAIRVEIHWHAWRIEGKLILTFGPIPVTWIRMDVCLDPVSIRAVSASLLGREKPLMQGQKEKGRSRNEWMLRSLRSFTCRKMHVRFDLGIASDAAATALGYGVLNGLTQSLVTWARQQGAGDLQGTVQAYFSESKYDGNVEGIFSTNVAHSIVSILQSWRNRTNGSKAASH